MQGGFMPLPQSSAPPSASIRRKRNSRMKRNNGNKRGSMEIGRQ